MMAVVKYDVVAKNGTYKDRNGDEKTRWLKMGVCFESDKGLSIKIDSMPVGFDGWLSLMTPKPREDKPKQLNDIDEDIPF
jgi:hypothetical protein